MSQPENYNLGDSLSKSSENCLELFGTLWGGQYICEFGKGVHSNQAHLVGKGYYYSEEQRS